MESKVYTPEEVLNLQSVAYQKGINEGYQLCSQEIKDQLTKANETIKVLTNDNNKLKGQVEGLKGMIMRHAIAFANWLLPSGSIANEKDYELFLMKPEAVLDGSAAGREDADVLALMEWLKTSNWGFVRGIGWQQYGDPNPSSYLSTAELFELFKQQKEK